MFIDAGWSPNEINEEVFLGMVHELIRQLWRRLSRNMTLVVVAGITTQLRKWGMPRGHNVRAEMAFIERPSDEPLWPTQKVTREEDTSSNVQFTTWWKDLPDDY